MPDRVLTSIADDRPDIWQCEQMQYHLSGQSYSKSHEKQDLKL
jgi:hypothetical protein